jgi:hypothetical protein
VLRIIDWPHRWVRCVREPAHRVIMRPSGQSSSQPAAPAAASSDARRDAHPLVKLLVQNAGGRGCSAMSQKPRANPAVVAAPAPSFSNRSPVMWRAQGPQGPLGSSWFRPPWAPLADMLDRTQPGAQ